VIASVPNAKDVNNLMATIPELIEQLYEDNYSHFDFIDNMNGGDCDCVIHLVMNTLQHHNNKEANA
jgi:hypothetical protein